MTAASSKPSENTAHRHEGPSAQLSLEASGPWPLPDWLPDESFFSWASRYHVMSGHRLPEQTSLALFGARRWGYQHDFPSPLNAFVGITHGAFGDAKVLASDRTILPFYLAHRDAVITENAYAGIAAPHSGMLKYRLGILTSRFRANHPLKACPQCMAEDAHRVGAPYWHLKHQLPGVWVCPMHGLPLQTCRTKATGMERFAWVLPAQGLLTKTTTTPLQGEALQRLLKLAELAMSWAALPASSLSHDHLGRIYRARLNDRYGPAGRRAAAENYRASIAPLLAVDELQALPSSDAQAVQEVNRWVFAPRGSTHPLRHLALIHWLFDDWTDFISSLKDTSAAPCQPGSADVMPGAPRSSDPRKGQVIERMREGESASRIAKDVNLAVQTVIAWGASAGIDTKKRPKQLKGDRYPEMFRALQAGRDKVAVATEFDVSVQTVTRMLRSEVGLSEAWHRARSDRARSEARSTWLSITDQYGHLGIKYLRELQAATYAWLYRNDPAWLVEQTLRATSARTNNSSVKWDERDHSLSQMVRRATASMVAQSRSRIRLGDLLAAVPELKAKQGALSRLPLTMQAISDALKRPATRASVKALL
jgi:transposase